MGEREYWKSPLPGGPSSFWATHRVSKTMIFGLAGIHLLMAILNVAAPEVARGVQSFLMLSPGDVLRRLRLWQLVTYALLHGGLWHLLMNCLGIWFFGRPVEERLGGKRYLLFALATVVAASLAFLLEAALLDESVPLIGASGFDFGVVVLCALWYPRMTVLLFFVLPVPLWAVALLFVFVEVVMLLELSGSVAHSAHLGGALYGYLYYRYGGSIDRVFAGVDRWQEKRRRHRAEQARRNEQELRMQVDRILDKVNKEGMSALTEQERRFLKEASERLRR